MEEKLDWSIREAWDSALVDEQEERGGRDYIYASEILMPMGDRLLKMRGVKATNPPDIRTLRVFEAGRMFERIVKERTKEAGLLIADEREVVSRETETMLSVHGRIDLVAGNDELGHLPYEIKTIQARGFHEYGDMPKETHTAQLLTYLKFGVEGYRQGRLLYGCKEHNCVAEFTVHLTEAWDRKITADIEELTRLYREGAEPPKPEKVVWNDDLNRYEKNWMLGYSDYLTYWTGLAARAEFDAEMKDVISSLNKLMKSGETNEAKKLFDSTNAY